MGFILRNAGRIESLQMIAQVLRVEICERKLLGFHGFSESCPSKKAASKVTGTSKKKSTPFGNVIKLVALNDCESL